MLAARRGHQLSIERWLRHTPVAVTAALATLALSTYVVAAQPGPSPSGQEQLKFTFDASLDGWTPGSSGPVDAEDWGRARWLAREGGIVELDGTGGLGHPNSWISHTINLPSTVRELHFDVAAHDTEGADAHFRMRLIDSVGSNTLLDEVVTGVPGQILFTSRSIDISVWAGQTVTFFFEQDDNGFQSQLPGATIQLPGGDEQIYIDNVEIPNDRDGDGLLDSWETNGLDVNGVHLDLPAMGADPDHKDVFVELDYMAPHDIPEPEIAQVVAAFAAAPVANPDGAPGIALHVDNGPLSEMDPKTHAIWGNLSRQDQIAHVDNLGTTVNGSYDWSAFQALKDANFEKVRKQVFHYAIAVHALGGKDASGISRGVVGGASDFIISQGQYVSGVDTDIGQGDFRANTFMHEFGHNLGLHHGGADDTNYKPNYLSVMNYAFLGLLLKANLTGVLDYSRFVVPFDETKLDESVGFDLSPGTGPADFLTAYICPDGSTQSAPLAAAPVDWNCDGSIALSTVSTDINGDTQIGVLSSQTDWDKLVFDGGLVGEKTAPNLPMLTVNDEPTRDEVEANAGLLRACAAALVGGASNCVGVTAPGPGTPGSPTAVPPTALSSSSPSPGASPIQPSPSTAAVSSNAILLAGLLIVVLLIGGALLVMRRRRPGAG